MYCNHLNMSGDFCITAKSLIVNIYRYIDMCHYRIKKDGKHPVVKNM